jgi:GNAT superfamily N-acetyltransferase
MGTDSTAADVRLARAADADAFAEQRIQIFQSLGQLEARADIERFRSETRAAFLEALEQGSGVVWLASNHAGEIVGSAALLFWPRFPSIQVPTRAEAYLAHLFVRPDARRRGLGSALVCAALAEARRRKLVRLRLHATEEGRDLYETLGFRPRTNDMDIYLEREGAR